MKKVVCIVSVVLAIGLVFVVFPYFRKIESPKQKYAYARSFRLDFIIIPDNVDVYEDGEKEYTVIREANDFKTLNNSFGLVTKYFIEENVNYILANDIDFAGLKVSCEGKYTGVFDGNGRTIKKADIDNGLFSGGISETGIVRYLRVDSSCTVKQAAITSVNEGDINNVINAANVSGKAVSYSYLTKLYSVSVAGGLVYTNNGMIQNSENIGNVEGNGGIACINEENGYIYNSKNGGLIEGSGDYSKAKDKTNVSAIGGAVGNNKGKIEYFYNCGNVGSSAYVAGGIAGESTGSITYGENDADVVAVAIAGGIVGTFSGSISNSINYAFTKATSQAGIAGGISGKATATGSIKNCTNYAVVIGNSSSGIVTENSDYITQQANKNYGRLNGKTEFTVKIDNFLDSYKLVIVGVIVVLLIVAIVMMTIDRYNFVKDRRIEIENIIYYGCNR